MLYFYELLLIWKWVGIDPSRTTLRVALHTWCRLFTNRATQCPRSSCFARLPHVRALRSFVVLDQPYMVIWIIILTVDCKVKIKLWPENIQISVLHSSLLVLVGVCVCVCAGLCVLTCGYVCNSCFLTNALNTYKPCGTCHFSFALFPWPYKESGTSSPVTW